MGNDRPFKFGSVEEGEIEPTPAEVESARLLANETRERLEAAGIDFDTVRTLADEYIACDLGEDSDEFVRWALQKDDVR